MPTLAGSGAGAGGAAGAGAGAGASAVPGTSRCSKSPLQMPSSFSGVLPSAARGVCMAQTSAGGGGSTQMVCIDAAGAAGAVRRRRGWQGRSHVLPRAHLLVQGQDDVGIRIQARLLPQRRVQHRQRACGRHLQSPHRAPAPLDADAQHFGCKVGAVCLGCTHDGDPGTFYVACRCSSASSLHGSDTHPAVQQLYTPHAEVAVQGLTASRLACHVASWCLGS